MTDVRMVQLDPLTDDTLLAGWVDAGMDSARHELGDRHARYSADEVRERSRTMTDRRFVLFAALVGDQVVAEGNVHLPVLDNLHLATSWMSVRPAWRRRGIGTRLLGALQTAARADGRTTHVVVAESAAGGGGAASVFAAAHGYSAARVNVRSDLEVDAVLPGRLAEQRAAAERTSAEYELLTWWDAVPEPWLAQRAALSARMATDAPTEDVDSGEEHWDADRVRAEVAAVRAMGRRLVETVAVRSATGQAVAYTTMVVAEHEPDRAYQWDTLVHAEHRGRALGTRVKAANLLALLAQLPAVRRVTTWNARTNEPMLRVNRELGFHPVGASTEWQKIG